MFIEQEISFIMIYEGSCDTEVMMLTIQLCIIIFLYLKIYFKIYIHKAILIGNILQYYIFLYLKKKICNIAIHI